MSLPNAASTDWKMRASYGIPVTQCNRGVGTVSETPSSLAKWARGTEGEYGRCVQIASSSAASRPTRTLGRCSIRTSHRHFFASPVSILQPSSPFPPCHVVPPGTPSTYHWDEHPSNICIPPSTVVSWLYSCLEMDGWKSARPYAVLERILSLLPDLCPLAPLSTTILQC